MSKEPDRLWEDYTSKGNSFSNWLTSLIISNFVYLIHLNDRRIATNGNSLWVWSLILSSISIGCMFLFRVLGVYAARKRFDLEKAGKDSDKDQCLGKIESVREILFGFFVFSAVAGFVTTFLILCPQLFP